MATIFQCKFIRFCAHHVNSNFISDNEKKFEYFNKQFSHIGINKKTFIDYLKRYITFARKKKLKIEAVEEFDIAAWEKCSDDIKMSHSLKECKPCSLKALSLVVLPFAKPIISSPPPCSSSFSTSTPLSVAVGLPLPAFSPSTISAVFHSSPSTISLSSHNLSTPTSSKLSTRTPLNGGLEDSATPVAINISIPVPDKKIVGAEKVAAEAVLRDIGSQFKSIYNKEFTDVVPKVPGSNLQNRLTNAERVKKLRKLHKAVKSSIEETSHSREAKVVYGTRQSKSQYKTQRLAYHFESKENAETRTNKRKIYLDYFFLMRTCFSRGKNSIKFIYS